MGIAFRRMTLPSFHFNDDVFDLRFCNIGCERRRNGFFFCFSSHFFFLYLEFCSKPQLGLRKVPDEDVYFL